MQSQLLRLPRVLDRTALSRTELYRRLRVGEFPKPIALGKRAVAWSSTVIDQWIAARQQAAGRVEPQQLARARANPIGKKRARRRKAQPLPRKQPEGRSVAAPGQRNPEPEQASVAAYGEALAKS